MLESQSRINQLTGIGIVTESDGTVRIAACGIRVQSGKLDFGLRKEALMSLDELVKLLPEGEPVALNLSGKGVLSRQLAGVEEINQGNFSLVMPQANIEDFYLQQVQAGGVLFVAVIRKATADNWLAELTDLRWVPVMLSLGAFPAMIVSAQLNVYDSELIFDGHDIKRGKDGEWLSYQYRAGIHTPFQLKIEEEKIHEQLLIPYAIAFQVALARKLDPVKVDAPAIDGRLEKFVESNRFKLKSLGILLVFLLLLMINFGLFSWLRTENVELNDEMASMTHSTTEMQQIQQATMEKEALLHKLGWEGNFNKSVLIDRVVQLLPPGLKLTEIALDPLDPERSRMEKTTVFSTFQLRIKGTAEQIIPVNEWMYRVKTIKSVKDVQLENYTYNNEDNLGQFTLLIQYQ